MHIPSSSLPLQGTIIAFGPIGPPPAPLRYFIKKHETPEESQDQDPDFDHESSTLKPLENYEMWTIEETRKNLIGETGTTRPNPLKRTTTHPTSTPATPEQPRTRSNTEKQDNRDKRPKQKTPDSRESSRNQEESTARSLAVITTNHRRPAYENLPEDNIDHEDYTQTLRQHETRIRLATQETDPYIASILSELPKLRKRVHANQRLEEKARAQNTTTIPVRADGNCLLHAIKCSIHAKYQINLLPHQELRYLASKKAQRYIEQANMDDTIRTMEIEALEKALQLGCITYPVSFIQALATICRGNIFIWEEYSDRPQIYSPIPEMIPEFYEGQNQTDLRTIHILHRTSVRDDATGTPMESEHFNGTKPIQNKALAERERLRDTQPHTRLPNTTQLHEHEEPSSIEETRQHKSPSTSKRSRLGTDLDSATSLAHPALYPTLILSPQKPQDSQNHLNQYAQKDPSLSPTQDQESPHTTLLPLCEQNLKENDFTWDPEHESDFPSYELPTPLETTTVEKSKQPIQTETPRDNREVGTLPPTVLKEQDQTQATRPRKQSDSQDTQSDISLLSSAQPNGPDATTLDQTIPGLPESEECPQLRMTNEESTSLTPVSQKKRKPTHRSQRKKRFAAPSNMTDPTDLAVQRPQHRTDTDSPSSLSPNEAQNTGTPIPPNEAHSTNDPTAPSATPGTEPFEFESRPPTLSKPSNWSQMSKSQKQNLYHRQNDP